MRRLRLVLCAALLLVLWDAVRPDPWRGVTAAELARLNEHRILGLAELEAGNVEGALKEFAAIARARPRLALGHVNQAALLALGDQRRHAAIEAAHRGADLLPREPLPRLILAQLYEMDREPEKAKASLTAAARLETRDPRILFLLAQRLELAGKAHERRTREVKRTLARLALDNLAAQLEWLPVQTGEPDLTGAVETLDRIERLLGSPSPDSRGPLARLRRELHRGGRECRLWALVLQNILKREPRYRRDWERLQASLPHGSLVLLEWDPPPPRFPEPPSGVRITWTDATQEAGLGGKAVRGDAPVAAGDVDLRAGTPWRFGFRSYPPDLQYPDLVAGASPGNVVPNLGGRFARHLPADTGPGSPLLTDLDNDGGLDLYLARPDGDRIWLNPRRRPSHPFLLYLSRRPGARRAFASRLPARGPGSALAADLDLDGNLDIVRASGAADQPAVRWLRHDGRLGLSDCTRRAGLFLPSGGARQSVSADVDGNGSPDLFVVRSQAPCRLLLNDGRGRFRPAGPEWSIRPEPGARGAGVADFDRDGFSDLVVVGGPPHGTRLYYGTGTGFRQVPAPVPDVPGEWVEVLDYDNDAWPDFAVAGSAGLRLFRNVRGRLEPGGFAHRTACAWTGAVDYDRDGDLDLLAAEPGGALRLLRNHGAPHPSLTLELEGRPGIGGQSATSFGLGAELEVETAQDRQFLLATGPQIHAGIGRAGRALVVRVRWPDGSRTVHLKPPSGVTVQLKQVVRGW